MGNPEQIGDIRLFAELFRGATTTVYKGFQQSLDRFVLLKVLNREFSDDAEIARRFEEEARLAARVQHSNVVPIYAYGRDRDYTYIATEFVEGMTLADLVKNFQLPPSLASYVLYESSQALKAAHDKGILHRDIKPSNILLAHTGQVKVADFGMASLFQESPSDASIRGTVAYLAPEIVLGEPLSPASDLFSLGATFFEAMLGEPAFQGSSTRQILDRVVNHDPTSLLQDKEAIDTQLRRICQQLLRKKPQQRYQNCSVLLSDLEGYKRTRGTDVIGNATEMRRFMENPDTYRSPVREKAVSVRSSTRAPRPRPVAAKDKKAKTGAKRESRSGMSRIFVTVGILVLLFAGLSLAGNFFFSKDGVWGGNNNSRAVSSSPSSKSETVEVQRSNASGGSAVQAASGGAGGENNGAQANISGQAQPVEVIDKSGSSPEPPPTNVDDVTLTSIPNVDTVIVLPDQDAREMGRVRIDASPWAVVYFEGDSIGTTPLPPIAVSPGTYKIGLKNPDFPMFETLVDVLPDRETPVEISLWTIVGSLQVEVYPYAKVYIDEVLIDETPLDNAITVEPGSHLLTLEHPTLGVFESTFEIAAGESKTLQFNLNELR